MYIAFDTGIIILELVDVGGRQKVEDKTICYTAFYDHLYSIEKKNAHNI